jgi:hypothetical protein
VPSLLIRALKVPLPVVETADGVSSYPVRNSLIFLKPCARATVEADTKAITAIDTPSLRIPFTSKDSFVAKWGAHNITIAEISHEEAQKSQKLNSGFILCFLCLFVAISFCATLWHSL